MSTLKNAIGGIALIASTAIGAAILALPISTAQLGFVQTAFCFLACWFFMTLGALYVLEANLFVGYGTNLISMAEKTLGSAGKYLTWGVYLILLYALTAAHLVGIGEWLHKGLGYIDISLSHFHGALITSFCIIAIILLGTAIVDWINRILMIGLMSIFGTLLFTTLPHVDLHLIVSQPTQFDLRPFSLIITAFGSAIVIPTLTEYLKGNARQLVWIVLIGSLIPLIVYLTWEFAIVGVIPLSGNPGLLQLQQSGQSTTGISAALEVILHNRWITQASSFLSIFALNASFLGLCLSLFDFLADGLAVQKNLKGKLLLALISFLPPLVFIFFYPYGFNVILSLAGLFVAILLGILPALMVWRARYHFPTAQNIRIVGGGKIVLLLTVAFFIFIIGVELFNQWEMQWGR